MSSIETAEEEIAAFYKKELVPLALCLREQGTSFFPLKPDSGAATYFEEVREAESLCAIDVDTLAERLREQWTKEGQVALAELARPLMDLANRIPKEEEQSKELSPFVYVMF